MVIDSTSCMSSCVLTAQSLNKQVALQPCGLYVACQVPLSIDFSSHLHPVSSGLPFPSSGDLPDPGIEPGSPALAGRFFTF